MKQYYKEGIAILKDIIEKEKLFFKEEKFNIISYIICIAAVCYFLGRSYGH